MPTNVNRDGHIPSHINGLNVLLINSFEISLQWRDAMKSERKARDSFQRGWKVQFVWKKYIFKNYNFKARLSSRKSARWFQRRIVPVGGKQLPFQDQLDTETQAWTKYIFFKNVKIYASSFSGFLLRQHNQKFKIHTAQLRLPQPFCSV